MRDERVDALRFIGLTLVVLAHSDLPVYVRQIRNFDVPLLVLVSGMSFGLSAGTGSYARYWWRRVERLLLPSWIFLTAYYLANIVMLVAVQSSISPVTSRAMQAAFLLRDQGYFWIIRVFLLVALIAPLVARLDRAVPDSRRYLVLVLGAYGLYETARLSLWPALPGPWAGPLTEWVLYGVPYAVVFAVGLRIDAMPRRLVAGLGLACLGVGVVAAVVLGTRAGAFVPTQQLKYPPSAYYIAYGLGVGSLLTLIPARVFEPLSSGGPAGRAILFAGRNSLWVFLWHIVFAELIDTNFALKVLMVLAGAAAVTFLQVTFVRRTVLPRLRSPVARAHVLRLFTG